MIRVLLADDQTLVRQGIRGLLDLSGEVEVVAEAEDGETALSRIRKLSPDVALLDVRMPALTGVEVVRKLRTLGDKTPAILLTTFDDDEVLLDGIRAGISGYLLKDVGSDQLLVAIRRVAKGETLILPAVSERAVHFVKQEPADFESSDRPDRLTRRELEVLRMIAGGFSNREIADALGGAEGTIKNHVSNILAKIGVRDRTRAVLKALEMGWLTDRR